MTTSKKLLKAQVLSTILLAVLSAPLPLAAVEDGETAQGKQWGVTYREGPITVTRGKKKKVQPLASGAKLKIRFDSGRMVCRARKTDVLSIPVTDVTEIVYDAATHRVSKAVLGGVGEMMSSGGACYPPEGCGALVLGGLMAAAVTVPFKYTNHFVEIAWQGEDGEQHLVFQVGKGGYESFLEELGSATGQQWKNVAQEKKAVHQAINGGNGCQDPALAGNDLSLAPRQIGTMEAELNAAAACGFRFVSCAFTPYLGLAAKMQKEAAPPAVYQYLVLHPLRVQTMRRQLNLAGAQGFRLRPDSLMQGAGGVLALIMEKSPHPEQQQYGYLYYSIPRRSKRAKKIEEGREPGYELAASSTFGVSQVVILEKPLGIANEAAPVDPHLKPVEPR